jgi:hypothetical protein
MICFEVWREGNALHTTHPIINKRSEMVAAGKISEKDSSFYLQTEWTIPLHHQHEIHAVVFTAVAVIYMTTRY